MEGDVYVSLRPCGCKNFEVPASRPNALETMPARLTGGWSLAMRSAANAAQIPTACDVCTPIRQEQLL